MTEKMLETLRGRNPDLKIHSVLEPAFTQYGRVLNLGKTQTLMDALNETEIPESGNYYSASDKRLEILDISEKVRRTVFGGMDVQVGYCNGRGSHLDALEYHKCSEVNFSATGCVLLLALPEYLREGVISVSDVIGFYLPPDVMIEVFPRVMHFAPCRVSPDGFNCLVVLEKGVNAPIENVDTAAPGEEGLLWMRGKWLTAHPDSPQAEKGAFAGVSGENIEVLF